ncbi:MAG: hypothetical protein ACLQCB_12740 [Spirochaetia bacterium]
MKAPLMVLLFPLLVSASAWGTPAVIVSNQPDKDDTVTIAQVVSDGPGWIVIHKEEGGGPGGVVGYAAVKDGENKDVIVKIDSYTATPKLFAMLHTDAGKVGTYEFPGPDLPVMLNGEMVNPSFMVSDLDARVVVKNQTIKASTVVMDEVLSNGPGWLVIHADSKGAPGPVIGYAEVKDGLTRMLKVKINAAKATPILFAMLHTDAGVVGKYEFPGPDVPVMVDEKMVSPGFKASR